MKAPQAAQQLGTSCSVQLLQEGAPGRKRGRVGRVPPLGCLCLQRDRGCRHRALPRPQVRSTFFAAGKRIRNIAQNSVIRASPLPSPSSPHRGTAHRRGRLHSTRLPQHSTWALTVQISTQHTIACLYSNTCLHVPCSYMPLSHPPLAYSCAQDQIQLNCCTPSPGLNSSRSFQGVFG